MKFVLAGNIRDFDEWCLIHPNERGYPVVGTMEARRIVNIFEGDEFVTTALFARRPDAKEILEHVHALEDALLNINA